MVLGRFLSTIPEWLTVTRVTLGKSRMDKFFSHYSRRTLTTIPPTSPPNQDDRSPRKRKLVAAFGAALAASGLALAYRVYSEDLKIEYKAQCAEDCQKCEDSACLRKMDKEEEMIAKANQDLEKALKDVKPKAQTATEAALKVTEVTKADLEKRFEAELESLLASEDCKSTLTENECAMILTHAYKKVLRVQKELAQVQEESDSSAVAADTITSAVLVQKIDEVRKFYEQDLIKSLSRQAQALQENFEAAKQAVSEEYERRLKQNKELTEAENLVDLRAKYSHATAALAAMKEALEVRYEEDIRSEKFKKLWAYCNSLYNRINYADFVANDVASDTISIDKKTLLQDFSDDEFVKVLLKSIPDEVSSSESLRQRFFNKVDKVCRRVAVFKDDEAITLWKYFLGVVQASLTTRCEGESEDNNAYAILDRTGLFLKRGDLLEAVCTLNNIEGAVARRICQDWLEDARAVLEANQTLFALMTHATANNLH